MSFADISTFYAANKPLVASLGALAGVSVLLVTANRLRAMKEHRATLLVANILTIIAAALATMVSASGMWKFFTDILGETPLRIAFFAFIEIALFASALLARSRLLRDPATGTTGVDGIAVWVLAGLTATLSALDSDSFREVCLRLVAPLVAAWMWERALAAERNVRLGKTAHRINWTLTPERILVWLRLAEASDRDVTEVDRARRRANLGRARLHLHLLQTKKSYAWRIRRAHRAVIRQAMAAAEHIGLADFPDATNEREAMQMYMATLYGFVDATSPQAVAHLNAWLHEAKPKHATDDVAHSAAIDHRTEDDVATGSSHGTNGVKVPTSILTGQVARDDTEDTTTRAGRAEHVNGHQVGTGTAGMEFTAPQSANDLEPMGYRHRPELSTFGQPQDLDSSTFQAAQLPLTAGIDEADTDDLDADEELSGHEHDGPTQTDDEATVTAVDAMRRFWDKEVASGRVPTGAELSRAAGVPPRTGLGRRKRREWEAELPDHLKSGAEVGA